MRVRWGDSPPAWCWPPKARRGARRGRGASLFAWCQGAGCVILIVSLWLLIALELGYAIGGFWILWTD